MPTQVNILNNIWRLDLFKQVLISYLVRENPLFGFKMAAKTPNMNSAKTYLKKYGSKYIQSFNLSPFATLN